MKKLLLLLLFIPLMSFGQTNFRKMSWGDSVEDLKKTYPEATFEKGSEGELDIFMQEGNLIGIEVFIAYLFYENELVAGMYMPTLTGYANSKDRLRDFYSISNRLNEKYTMEREDDWVDTTYKDNPNSLDHAIAMGDVILVEMGEAGDTKIIHNLSKGEHYLIYGSTKWVEIKKREQKDDF